MFNPLHSSTNQELFKKVATMKYTNDFYCTKEVIMWPPNRRFLLSTKMNGGHWLVHEEYIACTYCSMPKAPLRLKWH